MVCALRARIPIDKRRSNVPFPGLVKVQDANGHNLYYYFGADDKAVKNVLPEGDSDFWIPAEKTNYLLPRKGVLLMKTA